MNKKTVFLLIFTLIFFISKDIYSQQFTIDSVTINNVACHGYNNGVISVFIAGGTPPYNFGLNKGFLSVEQIKTSDLTNEQLYVFENIKPGNNYWIAVEDDNGEVIKRTDIKIVEPEKLSANIDHKPGLSDSNSSDVNIIVEGGIPPYQLFDEADNMISNSFEHNIKIENVRNIKYDWYVIDSNDCRLSIELELD